MLWLPMKGNIMNKKQAVILWNSFIANNKTLIEAVTNQKPSFIDELDLRGNKEKRYSAKEDVARDILQEVLDGLAKFS